MSCSHAAKPFHSHNTDIPIPRVYGYSLDAQNTVGCPFSIIEYINGNTAEEVARNHPGEHHGGIPAHLQEKFWRHIAKIMIQLASIRLPQIGSITRDGLDSFVVGPLVETGTGPYSSATEFYADYPLALSKSLGEQPASGQDELVQAFHSLAVFFPSSMARVGCGSSQGFGLANYDLNPNNVLVDREYNVLAVIDWDSVVSLHDAALYHFPFLMGISCAVPGVAATNLAVMKREQLSRQFAEIVEEVGQELAGKDQQGANKGPKYLLTKAGLFSKEAVTFRSLIYIKMRQGWVNNSWLQGLKWSREHNEMQVAKFYLGGSIFLEE